MRKQQLLTTLMLGTVLSISGQAMGQDVPPQFDLPPLPPLPGIMGGVQPQQPASLPPLPQPTVGANVQAVPGGEKVESFNLPPLPTIPDGPAQASEEQPTTPAPAVVLPSVEVVEEAPPAVPVPSTVEMAAEQPVFPPALPAMPPLPALPGEEAVAGKPANPVPAPENLSGNVMNPPQSAEIKPAPISPETAKEVTSAVTLPQAEQNPAQVAETPALPALPPLSGMEAPEEASPDPELEALLKDIPEKETSNMPQSVGSATLPELPPLPDEVPAQEIPVAPEIAEMPMAPEQHTPQGEMSAETALPPLEEPISEDAAQVQVSEMPPPAEAKEEKVEAPKIASPWLGQPPVPGSKPALEKTVATKAPTSEEDPRAFSRASEEEKAKEFSKMVEGVGKGDIEREFKDLSAEEQEKRLSNLLKTFESDQKGGISGLSEVTESPEEEEAGKTEVAPRESVRPVKEFLAGKDFKTQILPDTIYKEHYRKENSHLPPRINEDDFYARMFHAAYNGNVSVLRALIERGLDVNTQNAQGNTPLINAALGGQARTTALLLANNADPNIASTLGLTALHIAASKGHYQIVSSLLQSGANPNIESTDGVTPLRLAMLGNHDDVGQLLLQYRAKRETRFVSAMRDHLSNEGMDTTSLSVNQVRQQYARKMQQPSVPQGYHVPQQVTVHTPLPAPQISARPVTDPAQYARIQEAKKVFARLADINRYFPELSFEERAEINRKRLEYEQQYADVMPLLEAHERADIDSARFLWESWAQANKSRL